MIYSNYIVADCCVGHYFEGHHAKGYKEVAGFMLGKLSPNLNATKRIAGGWAMPAAQRLG